MRMTREPAARMQNQDVMIGVGPAVETTTISTLQTPRTKDMLPPLTDGKMSYPTCQVYATHNRRRAVPGACPSPINY
jgi:hypothetical protein